MRGRDTIRTVAASLVMASMIAPAPTLADDGIDEPIITAPARVEAARINTTQQDIELVVPVRERGPLGQASVIIGSNDAVRVKSEDLVRVLSRIVTPEATAALAAAADDSGYISVAAAEAVGFGLTFDPALLDLAVTIPLAARQRQSLALGFDTIAPDPEVTDRPEPFSVYLNYRATLDYVHREASGLDEGLQAPRLDLELNGTIGQVAFENQFTVDDDLDETFQRNASRLIYDMPDRALRWTLGDLIPEGRSLQSSTDIAGLSIARLYSLRPNDRFVSSRSSRTVLIRERSTVDIRVNGAVARTLVLEPGTYDLRDLPLTQGANAVEIVVEGPSGAREVVNFDFFSDSTLLAPGVDEFYVSAGVRAPRDFDGVDYLTDEPIVSGFYRMGVNEQLTVGGNLQATRDATLVGGEVVYGGRWGLTALDLAASDTDAGSGYAVRLEHRMYRDLADLPGGETLDLSLETRSRDFATIETFGRPLNYPYEIAARYSRALTRSLTASVGADYAKGRDVLEDRYGASFFGTWRATYETAVSFGASYTSNAFRGEEVNVFVNLIRRFGARRTLSASAESRNGLVRVGYAQAPYREVNALGYAFDVSRTDDAYGFNGLATYIGNRGDVELSHDTLVNEDGEIDNQISSVRAVGSIAYTGGRVSAGRRLYDSFALVDTHPSLGDRAAIVGGLDSEDQVGRSGPLGPAMAALGSYYPQSIPYDVEDLPIGYDLGRGLFQVTPRLHSGYALTIGSAFFVTATGNLIDRTGQPLALRTGRAQSIDDPDAPIREVITNRTGRFAVTGLSAGRWRLSFSGSSPVTYILTVPETTLFRAGELQPATVGE